MAKIRNSEYIFHYGPGAIIETPEGPGVMPLPDKGFFSYAVRPEDCEIQDLRMVRLMARGEEKWNVRIFQIPQETSTRFQIQHFPEWRICSATHLDENGRNFSVLHRSWSGCPKCGSKKDSYPVRFIRVCPNGHMDEIPWNKIVHHGEVKETHKWFRWYGSIGSIENVTIQCDECGEREKLPNVYQIIQRWDCTRRTPEREDKKTPFQQDTFCDRKMKVIHRNSLGVRVPELVTLFTIPTNPLQEAVSANSKALEPLLGLPEATFRSILPNLDMSQEHKDVLKRADVTEIKDQMLTQPQEVHSFYDEEFDALLSGKTQTGEFEVLQKKTVVIPFRDGTSFSVTPIGKLRSVTIQRGFRRLPVSEKDQQSRLVDTGFVRDDTKWYGGICQVGEGLFISLKEPQRPPHIGKRIQDFWEKAFQNGSKYPEVLFRDSGNRVEPHPFFIWWHTLSHLLIRSISRHAGYASASIRERVYVRIQDGIYLGGGVILYVTGTGTDGTLGGLLSLANEKKMEEIIKRAFQFAGTCSNDPLCREAPWESNSPLSGASCYACTLLSETSCEHRNNWLDRRVFLG